MRDTLGFGADDKSQWQYWARKAHPQLRFRNCGIYGQRTDEIAKRLDECAKGAQVLVVQGGINDIAQGRPVEPAAVHLRQMVERGKKLGLRVAIAELLPWNNGYPDADPKIRRLNELIRRIGGDEAVPVLPFYETLEDPDRPGRMREEWTSDGDHPSVYGLPTARRAGVSLALNAARPLRCSRPGSPATTGGGTHDEDACRSPPAQGASELALSTRSCASVSGGGFVLPLSA